MRIGASMTARHDRAATSRQILPAPVVTIRGRFTRACTGYRLSMQTTIDATGSASATLGWERYMNPDRWPEWAPQIMGVDYEHDRLTADTTGRGLAAAGAALRAGGEDRPDAAGQSLICSLRCVVFGSVLSAVTSSASGVGSFCSSPALSM